MAKPRLLDLFCGAGGCSVGYHRAGFEVVGVDIKPQPRFPFEFVQMDALLALENWVHHHVDLIGCLQGNTLDEFDAIHASPPCQVYSKTQKLRGNTHPDLIALTRELLEQTGLPYVIENVPGAPLRNPAVLEGQMFDGLRTQRKRWFETNWLLEVPFLRSPRPAPNAKMGRRPKPGEWVHVVGNCNDIAACRDAMGIDWMTRDELAQAIPPAYTEHIGHYLMAEVLARQGAARGEEHEQAPGESPTPDDDVIVRWECPECGWSIPDESSAGEGQPCEAWMLDDEIGEHGPTQKVRYRRIRSPQGEDD